MKYTRRLAVTGVMGVLATAAGPATAEVAAQQPPCSGNVRKDGKALHPGRVERAGTDSKDVVDTDSRGDYRFLTPASSPTYQLRFRDSAGSVFHTVDQLTSDPRIVQTVSVTAPPAKATFHSVYHSLQALESLVAFAQAFQPARAALEQDLSRIKQAVGTLRDAIGGADMHPAHVAFLRDKATTVERLSALPLA